MPESFYTIFSSLKLYYDVGHYCTRRGCINDRTVRKVLWIFFALAVYHHQSEFSRSLGPNEWFSEYKLVVCVDFHSSQSDNDYHFTLRAYNAMNLHVGTLHISDIHTATIVLKEPQNQTLFEYEKDLGTINGMRIFEIAVHCFWCEQFRHSTAGALTDPPISHGTSPKGCEGWANVED
ncbi:hypothetical protein BDZ97DRAFT_1760688 [Flammula alnicola]|nr:hypothetical protein BDZ97DRAFT_1760688 [Flammula alnicola]